MALAGASIDWNGDILETHKYVRFLPNSPQDLKVLDDSDLELFDTPFDYEVVTQGTYYHDAGLTREDYTWLYTVVPTNFQSSSITANSGINYEVIESLHLPDENDQSDPLVYAAFERCGLEHQLEEEDEPQGRVAFLRLKKRDVIGNINIHNTQLSGNEPLRNVSVVARSWFKIKTGFSDASGNFNINARFRTHAFVKMVFENNRFSMRGLATIGVWRLYKPNEKLMGLFAFRGMTNIQYTVDKTSNSNLTIRSRDWVLATMLNGAEYFNAYMNNNGIYYNQGRISIWATGLGNYASAPMLKTMNSPFHATYFATYFLLRGDVSAAASSLILSMYGTILGDVLIGYAERVNYSSSIHEVVFHELAHAYHYGLAGTCYWTNYINYIVANGGYGDGNGQHAEKVAVGEAFAYDLEKIVGFDKYPNITFNGSNYHQLGEESKGHTGHLWIPSGLFYDIWDNTPLNTFPSDDLVNLSLSEIFHSIDVNDQWECDISFPLISNRYKSAHPTLESFIDSIFVHHGK